MADDNINIATDSTAFDAVHYDTSEGCSQSTGVLFTEMICSHLINTIIGLHQEHILLS